MPIAFSCGLELSLAFSTALSRTRDITFKSSSRFPMLLPSGLAGMMTRVRLPALPKGSQKGLPPPPPPTDQLVSTPTGSMPGTPTTVPKPPAVPGAPGTACANRLTERAVGAGMGLEPSAACATRLLLINTVKAVSAADVLAFIVSIVVPCLCQRRHLGELLLCGLNFVFGQNRHRFQIFAQGAVIGHALRLDVAQPRDHFPAIPITRRSKILFDRASQLRFHRGPQFFHRHLLAGEVARAKTCGEQKRRRHAPLEGLRPAMRPRLALRLRPSIQRSRRAPPCRDLGAALGAFIQVPVQFRLFFAANFVVVEERHPFLAGGMIHRSEERRVGKECRSRWSPYH